MSERYRRNVVLATRCAALVVVALAALTTVLSYVGPPDHAGAAFDFIYLAIALVVPAIVAALRPTPRRLWIWAGFAWLVGTAYWIVVSGPGYGLVEPVRTLGALATGFAAGGAPVLAYAFVAAQVIGDESAPRRKRRVRLLLQLALGLAMVIAIVGFFPGTRIYEDVNENVECWSQSGWRGACPRSYTLLRATRDSGGAMLLVCLAFMLAPATLAYADPRGRSRLFWFGWSGVAIVVGGFTLYVLGFDAYFDHAVVLWPRQVVTLGLSALVALVGLVLPIVVVTAREDPVPAARVIDRA